ncbi:MAG: 16S rRNA (cytidine(1402)-2'-O)-methyltransferase [Sphingorhabdus sp.]
MSVPDQKNTPTKALESGLYIVATPIGNLADMSQRARLVLEAADIIAVEDSRVTGKLLNHFGIKKRMHRYNDHAKDADRDHLLDAARGGIVALVSDAGTPLISDPGYKLVRAARDGGIAVFGIPGPSAAITALSISGLPTDRFLFAGFLPSKAKARDDAIAELANLKATLVFYESGPRLGKTLAALAAALGQREAAVARELTKKFEEVVTGSLAELAERYAGERPKGEIVLIAGPPEKVAASASEIDTALADALTKLPPAKAAGQIARHFGLERKEVYERAMALKAKP